MRILTFTLFGLMLTCNAYAASHRTFVSADGTDSGTCGPTTPCRTLDYTLGQTNDGGEIVVIKSGGYGDATGGLTINKSISIIAEPGVFAALAPSTGFYGINIATAGINVAIKGLTINGRGGSGGINMTNGASLDLDNVTIGNFAGVGLNVQAAARVAVKNSTFKSLNYGIRAGNGANLLVSGSRLTANVFEGIQIYGGTSGNTVITVSDTLVQCTSASTGAAFDNYASTGTTGKLYLDRVTASNCYFGVRNEAQTPNANNVVAIANSFVTGNDTGLFNATTTNTFLSAGNNHIANNGTNTSGTIISGSILH